MDDVYVHSRVMARHPELSEDDVRSAWRNAIELVRRECDDGVRYVAAGADSRGRLIEMVAMARDGAYLIYHAMTPPSKKTLAELHLQGR